ncbi:MAG: pyridoxamine 5'-phosphate oxidase [Ardenticatenaceae bacterium]|nr:pyridoxamine 5'-phosphate oxidase [Ardenticatenaceae bacterium]
MEPLSATFPDDPLVLFAAWYQAAQDQQLPQPNAMSLATVSPAGEVSSRLVLLRTYDQAGFVFYTGLDTQKAHDLDQHAQAALLFPWLGIKRQVRVQGTAVKLSKTEVWQYFITRPRGSQLGAWLTQSSEVISSRSVLQAKMAGLKEKFQAGQIPLPAAWGGYRVRPYRYEFWQAQADGLADRLAYTQQDDGRWLRQRLIP